MSAPLFIMREGVEIFVPKSFSCVVKSCGTDSNIHYMCVTSAGSSSKRNGYKKQQRAQVTKIVLVYKKLMID